LGCICAKIDAVVVILLQVNFGANTTQNHLTQRAKRKRHTWLR